MRRGSRRWCLPRTCPSCYPWRRLAPGPQLRPSRARGLGHPSTVTFGRTPVLRRPPQPTAALPSSGRRPPARRQHWRLPLPERPARGRLQPTARVSCRAGTREARVSLRVATRPRSTTARIWPLAAWQRTWRSVSARRSSGDAPSGSPSTRHRRVRAFSSASPTPCGKSSSPASHSWT